MFDLLFHHYWDFRHILGFVLMQDFSCEIFIAHFVENDHFGLRFGSLQHLEVVKNYCVQLDLSFFITNQMVWNLTIRLMC
jgi:hypothetical protein